MTNTTEAALRDLVALANRYSDTMGLTREGAIRRIGVLVDAILDAQPSPASSTEERDAAINAVAKIEMDREGYPLSRTQEEIYADAAEMVDVVLSLSNSSGEPAKEEPTAKGDRVAGLMRDYFEAHKKDKWDGFSADHLMGGLLNIVRREYRLVEPASVAEEAGLPPEAIALLSAMACEVKALGGDPMKALHGASVSTISALPKPTPVEDGALWDAAFRLATAASALNIATDGMDDLRGKRQEVLAALKALASLSETLPQRKTPSQEKQNG